MTFEERMKQIEILSETGIKLLHQDVKWLITKLWEAVEVIQNIGNCAGGPHGGVIASQNGSREVLLRKIADKAGQFLASLDEAGN